MDRIVNRLKACCEEALGGEWDRSDDGFIAMREALENLKFNVTVEVRGGVAYVTKCPKNVKVRIIDHDNH